MARHRRYPALILGIALVASRAQLPSAPSEYRLLAGVGAVHHPISTPSPEAQKFFDQGLALLYGFNFPDAVRSFRRAAEFDPKSPMPFWGIAWANGPNYNLRIPSPAAAAESRNATRTALLLSRTALKAERAYVEALARCFPDIANGPAAAIRRDCANAMRELHRAYPGDSDASALFAASLMNIRPGRLWTPDGKPEADTPEIVAVLEEVLRRWPEHLGANHLYIHAVEGSLDPERAMASAHRLETLAPAAGHLLHMPSHVYLRTGDYWDAVRCNQRAVAADDAYQNAQSKETVEGTGYSRHDLHFLAVAACMDGEYRVASDAAARLQVHVHSGASIVMPIVVLLRFGRWDDVLAWPAPGSEMDGVQYFWRYARGFAYASKGDLDSALHERRAMKLEFANLPTGSAFGMFSNDWGVLDQIASAVLDARIAAAGRDVATSIRLWEKAATLQDRLNFDEIPDWYYPVRESWGAALLRDRRAAEAESVFKQDLVRNPRNPRSLFGLCTALEAQGKTQEASSIRRAFEAAWKGDGRPRIEDF